jgi:hypothetical protein
MATTKKGYVIAKNRVESYYFTASGSYDYPDYVPISEATVYHTPEAAEKAAAKLWKHGSYRAAVIPLDELFDAKLDDKMVTGIDTSKDIALTDDEDSIDDNGEFVPDEDDSDGMSDESSDVDPDESELMGDDSSAPNPPQDPNAVTESTAPPIPSVISFKAPSSQPNDFDYAADAVGKHDAHKVPTAVVRELKASIEDFELAYEYNQGKDDAQASHALTVAQAMKDLLQDLSQGTEEGYTQACIRYTTYMNAITMHLPDSVIKYLMKKERQSKPLLNVFYDNWQITK